MVSGNLPSVAVVGTGYWGKNLVRNFAAIGALQCICEADSAVRTHFRTQYPTTATTDSFAELLTDESLDAVAIATPAETHASLVHDALLAGKDVYVEKPLCLSVDEGRELVELAEQHNRILMVGHLLWYHTAILKLKQLIDVGQLGRIEYIYSNRLNLGKIRREENILWSFAPHDISVILGLLNDEMPDSVVSQGGNYLHQSIADVTVSLLAFPSGVKAHIFVSWLHPFKEQKLVVVGDKQMAVFDDLAEHKLSLYPHSVSWENRLPVANKANAVPVPLQTVEPLRAECEHFLDCVRHRTRPRTDGFEGLRVLTVLDQCQQSLRSTPQAPQPDGLKSRIENVRIHDSAFIDDDVEIGTGTSIWHVSHVLTGSRIGDNCKIGQNVVIGPRATVGNGVKIQNNVSVYEGVTLGDHVFCGPSMVFTNVLNPRSKIPRMSELRTTLVRSGATLGANCTIVCGTTIGEHAFIGAGAVVTKDVPAHALVVGNPGRVVGWVCTCGEKISWDDGDPAMGTCTCGESFVKSDDDTIAINSRLERPIHRSR